MFSACSLRRQNELIAEDEKNEAEREKQQADKKRAKEKKQRHEAVEAKVATGLSSGDAQAAVDSDIAEQKAAAAARKEETAAVESKQELAQQRQEVDKLTGLDKDEEGSGDEKELAELGALVEGLLDMTQPSAVEAERKRLQELLSQAEAGTRKKRETEVVNKIRPALNKLGMEAEEGVDHPIQSVNDLARWHVEQLRQAEQKAEKQNDKVSDAEQTAPLVKDEERESVERAHAEAASQDSEESDDTEDADQAARDRLHEQLQGMLGKVRERLQSVDAEIGSSLHLLHPDSLTGQLDDAELIAAIQRLHAVKPEDVGKLIARIKKLASKRRAEAEGRTDGSGGGDERAVALSVSDITALAGQIREEQQAKKEDSGKQTPQRTSRTRLAERG